MDSTPNSNYSNHKKQLLTVLGQINSQQFFIGIHVSYVDKSYEGFQVKLLSG